MPGKLSYGYVKEYIESRNYKLLSNSYKNNSSKLLLECPFEHKFWIGFGSFQQGRRCSMCVNNSRHSYSDVKKFIESCNYKLLSKEYKNANEKLKIKCPNGHIIWMSYGHFYSGRGCPICKSKKHDYDYIKKFIEEEGYELLSNEFKSIHNYLKIRCPYEHEFQMTFDNFRKGRRCSKCYGNNKFTKNEIKSFIEEEGYKLLDYDYDGYYKNSRSKLLLECPEGHIFNIYYSNFRNMGNRCPICWAKTFSSKPEKKIRSFLKEIIDYEIIGNDRNTIVNPYTDRFLELDVWIPELNKAIEFNGEYWHSFDETKQRDKIKKDQCKNKNIELYIVNERDFINNEKVSLQNIKNFVLCK